MNNTITHYSLIRVDTNKLSEAVQSSIADGWQPYGPPHFREESAGSHQQYIAAYQPIVKYAEERVWKKLPPVDSKNIEH